MRTFTGQRGDLRAGYIGHLTALGNKLGELAGQRELIASALAGSTEWSIWLQKVLQPRNERENVHRWACGRPSQQDLVQRGNSADDSMLEVALSFFSTRVSITFLRVVA